MKAKSIKGKPPEEIKPAMQQSIVDGFCCVVVLKEK